jgi:hypothetical protein
LLWIVVFLCFVVFWVGVLAVRAPNRHDDRLTLLAQVLAEVVRVVHADAVGVLYAQSRVMHTCHDLCVHLITRRALVHHGRLLGRGRHVHLGVALCSQVCPASVGRLWGASIFCGLGGQMLKKDNVVVCGLWFVVCFWFSALYLEDTAHDVVVLSATRLRRDAIQQSHVHTRVR